MKIYKKKNATTATLATQRETDSYARKIKSRMKNWKTKRGYKNPTRVGKLADTSIEKFRERSGLF